MRDAGFDDSDIGFVVRDRNKGMALANDLNREYKSGDTPRHVISDDEVYDRFSDDYVDTVHRSNLPDEAVDWYRQHLDQGEILEIVNVGDRMADADRIIREHGGMLYVDQGRHAEAMPQQPATTGAMTTGPTKPETMGTTATPETTTRAETGTNEVRLPVIEEEVMVEKAQHKVGEIEVTSETSRMNVDLPTTLTHEEIRVERRKLDRPLTPDEYKGGVSAEQGTIRMPIVEEEVRVTKRAIIREEMVVTRVPVAKSETLHETVMHTEPHLKTTGEVEVQNLTEQERKRRPAA